ncbi:multidrug effflux MFS transporter [Haliea sp. E17]|uniref:multidrug effflux MFS transporter n=1 Tax=Haliea sp. E17 TaxID=3401576 RepID=UPI003AAD7AF7
MQHNQPIHVGIAILLAMTMAIGPFALDTFLPAFPAMAVSLGTSVHHISLSISVYVFSLAFGQLVAGPLADRFGRAVVMLSGLGIFAVASLLITWAQNLEELLGLRVLQAFGGGWATVCVPAIVRDRLSGNEAARFFSLIGLIMILAPAVAPSLGSAVLLVWGWRVIFLLLGLYAVAVALLLYFTVFRHHRRSPPADTGLSAWQRYRAVFATREALPYMVLQTLCFAAMLLFITHASFIYQQYYSAGPQFFALLFGANIVVMVFANLSNRRLLRYFPPQQILRWALSIQGVGVLLLVLVSLFQPRLWLFVPAMMITVGAMGAITPNTQACFMDHFGRNGGTAAALMGATQFSIAGLISAGSALLPESVSAIVLAQAACVIPCLALVWLRRRAG